jgi:hypothetical protein
MNDRGHPDSPELNLWRRVLIVAMDDLTAESRNIRRQAFRWFVSRQQGIGSSRWVAQMLDLDHGYLVKRVLMMIAVRRPVPKPKPQLELAL